MGKKTARGSMDSIQSFDSPSPGHLVLSHGPPAPHCVLPLSNVNTLSADSRMTGLGGLPPVGHSMHRSPEQDGFAMELYTAPSGSLNPILQQNVLDVEVEENGDPELDDIVSPRLNVVENANADSARTPPDTPQSDENEDWELTSCSTSTADEQFMENQALRVLTDGQKLSGVVHDEEHSDQSGD